MENKRKAIVKGSEQEACTDRERKSVQALFWFWFLSQVTKHYLIPKRKFTADTVSVKQQPQRVQNSGHFVNLPANDCRFTETRIGVGDFSQK